MCVCEGASDRLGGHGVAAAPEGSTDRVYQRYRGHDVPQGTEVLPHVGQGLLHRLSHRLRGHLRLVPHPQRKQGNFITLVCVLSTNNTK